MLNSFQHMPSLRHLPEGKPNWIVRSYSSWNGESLINTIFISSFIIMDATGVHLYAWRSSGLPFSFHTELWLIYNQSFWRRIFKFKNSFMKIENLFFILGRVCVIFKSSNSSDVHHSLTSFFFFLSWRLHDKVRYCFRLKTDFIIAWYIMVSILFPRVSSV